MEKAKNTFKQRAIGGYDIREVDNFIEKLTNQFSADLEEKEKEIRELKKINQEIKDKMDEMIVKSVALKDEESKISKVLLKAEEQANEIVEEAQIEAKRYKENMKKMLESESFKLEKARNDLKNLKSCAIRITQQFEDEIKRLTDEEEG